MFDLVRSRLADVTALVGRRDSLRMIELWCGGDHRSGVEDWIADEKGGRRSKEASERANVKGVVQTVDERLLNGAENHWDLLPRNERSDRVKSTVADKRDDAVMETLVKLHPAQAIRRMDAKPALKRGTEDRNTEHLTDVAHRIENTGGAARDSGRDLGHCGRRHGSKRHAHAGAGH